MTQTIEQLTARVRELEEENARLKAECDDIKQVQFPRKLEAVAVGWKKRLAASQAYAKQLRKWVIDNCTHADTCDSLLLDDEGKHMACSCGLTAALASDTSALDAYDANQREAAYQEARRAAAQFEAELARQRDLAVEALEITVNSWSEQFERHGHLAPEWAVKCRNALSTIKES